MRHDAGIATLVHLNGPPGVGKSTIASALVDTRPLALAVDIDTLRTWFGQWETQKSSMGLAREAGYAMASSHLKGRADVVLPQLDTRDEVIALLATIAEERSAHFVEVILSASTDELAARIARSPSSGPRHPRDLFSPAELATQIEHYRAELDRLAGAWPGAIRVDVSGLSPADAAAAVRTTIAW